MLEATLQLLKPFGHPLHPLLIYRAITHPSRPFHSINSSTNPRLHPLTNATRSTVVTHPTYFHSLLSLSHPFFISWSFESSYNSSFAKQNEYPCLSSPKAKKDWNNFYWYTTIAHSRIPRSPFVSSNFDLSFPSPPSPNTFSSYFYQSRNDSPHQWNITFI